MSSRHNSSGFTLVELMVTITLLGVLAFIAVPNFTQFSRNNQLQAKAEELKTFLVLARSEAVVKRMSVKLDMSKPGAWQAQQDNQPLRQLDFDSNTAKLVATVNGGSAISELTYRANGTSSADARFTVCHDKDPATGYLLRVRPNGNVTLYQRGKDDDNSKALDKCE